MSIKTELYGQWSATAQAAGEELSNALTASKSFTAETKCAAYEDGARILHDADGMNHVKKTLRERMSDTALRTRRNYYAYMLNDIEAALERGGESKAVADADRA